MGNMAIIGLSSAGRRTGRSCPIMIPLLRVRELPSCPRVERMYKRNIDLMDETVFPRKSIYLAKENPIPTSRHIDRETKSDEEIIAAVTSEMINSLGEDLEP
jgi:hypothetical protein